MTLYYSIVFALLCFEMAMFMVLIIPLPFTWRRKLFHFLATNPVVAKIQYGLKITFIFVAVLFVDAVQRMVKVMSEGETARDNRGVQDVRTETNYAARKFYSQRNMYLTGFTLFLSLILSRSYSLILDLINTQEELVALKKGAKTSSSGADIEKKYLTEIDTLKKQAKQQQEEYNRLSDELAKATGNTSTKKD
ncbi:uncharacterized protein UMAG_02396 [Mycosarcoma maydis]|uniref:Endoplasmic reticulum transmembrane protein n=1 Tax=Mycosarcoma maydis TaxID=5270 RepID=A0A0D1E664_MYCMD|nr:uncharacterized protein UMAG_02396 [Ustilago maydis 521]KIS69880.1 hypothetical protein UMAG_02396 [Ustilago maydis 521]|eukprot:XP_011388692.1 hypothetical protein UMAG_02396 [Ustilago maydis 521]